MGIKKRRGYLPTYQPTKRDSQCCHSALALLLFLTNSFVFLSMRLPSFFLYFSFSVVLKISVAMKTSFTSFYLSRRIALLFGLQQNAQILIGASSWPPLIGWFHFKHNYGTIIERHIFGRAWLLQSCVCVELDTTVNCDQSPLARIIKNLGNYLIAKLFSKICPWRQIRNILKVILSNQAN